MRGENGKEKGMEKGKKEKGKENGKGERESKRRKEILNICPTTLSTDFQIDGNGLPAVSKVKDLGITFDSNLSATSHVRSVVVTTNQRVNLLLRSFLTRNRSVLVKA